MIELEEFEPHKWRVKRAAREPARSDLPLPNVISDIMEPTEQVDGRFYTSKHQFRKVGRSLGLIEVGNEKPKPRRKTYETADYKAKRREHIKIAVEKVRAGHRARAR
jgi:hypothetical protein